jgi:hypothetical protein
MLLDAELDPKSIPFRIEDQESFVGDSSTSAKVTLKSMLDLHQSKEPVGIYYSPLTHNQESSQELQHSSIPTLQADQLDIQSPEFAAGYYSVCFKDTSGHIVKIFKQPSSDLSQEEIEEYHSIQFSQLEYYIKFGGQREGIPKVTYIVVQDGEIVGYAIPEIEHTMSLDVYFSQGNTITQDQIDSLLERLSSITTHTGFQHGDLVSLVPSDNGLVLEAYVNTRNILVGTDGRLHLIDFNPGGFFNTPVTTDQEYILLERYLRKFLDN